MRAWLGWAAGSRRRPLRWLVPGLVALTVAGTAAAYSLPELYGGRDSTCFWNIGVVNGGTINIAYPDADANYWAAGFTLPAGATLQLHGAYPHARFASISSYNLLGVPLDALVDYQITPDRGSRNPFRSGVPRTVARRAFTLTLSASPPPHPLAADQRSGRPARNTLFITPRGDTTGLHILLWRVYVPDRRQGLRGGVPLPRPVLRLADGTVETGSALCHTLTSQVHRLPDISALLIPASQYAALRYQPGVPPYFPARRRPVWRVQYNRAYLLGLYAGPAYRPSLTGVTKSGQAGFFPNIDNQYARAAINRKLGRIVAFRGTLPTTPHTVDGERFLRRNTQLRYVSFCMNESVLTTRVMGCVDDEQIPLGPHRRYVVVTSRRADRPSNATARCGVAWLRWSPRGDGGSDHDFGWMQLRNMLPSPSFDHAIQSTRVPGDERRVMGPYLPTGTYYSGKRAFERLGCPVAR
ncbi:MAG TPA: hypothetical protein VFN55_13125 [Solirubrobacteraceae bacterium]|nr:hypothetical protein [Solirubrobacteraceae bacterium]